MSDRYEIRQLKPSDQDQVLEVMKSHRMILGVQEILTWHRLDPEGLLVAEDKQTGQVIGSISGVRYTDNSVFIGLYVVLKEHQNRGVGKLLWQKLMQRCANRNIGLFARDKMFNVYRKLGLNWITPWNLVRYEGRPQLDNLTKSIEGIQLVDIDDKNLGDVNAFDFAVSGLNRSVFNCLNVKEQNSIAMVAIRSNDNSVAGYAVVKQANYCWTLAPLYADSDEVAELLTSGCLSRLPADYELFTIRCFDDSSGVRLANKLKLESGGAIPGLFSKKIVGGDLSRVYAITSINFFPV